jgi:hypothetical protein
MSIGTRQTKKKYRHIANALTLCATNQGAMWRLTIPISIFLSGCTIPATVLFRSYSNGTVRLQATLVDRRRFEKLPNKVDFYDTSTKKPQFFGVWQASSLVTWVDTTTFYVDVPPFTVVDVADVSRGLVLGAGTPDVLLLMMKDKKVDTLTTGDYSFLAEKFQSTGYGLFRNPVYYYDIH